MRVKASVGWEDCGCSEQESFATHRHGRLNACVQLPRFLYEWGARVAGEQIMILEIELHHKSLHFRFLGMRGAGTVMAFSY